MKRKTTLVRDLEQAPTTIDTIECPNCGKVQQARLVLVGLSPKHIHKCVSCGITICRSTWKSLATSND